ncbi:hypothetical protein CC85DRAFT_300894 [Cutaneotrichosporon oleaginosum]|uniref:Uncharacterized protein n=1 Tax=Cutaneotrichosporon oleaginosum TaxID=879819 RepID=A0A0J0XSD1_9TREE|nr:uncharacterized protein CC85DRAFT_300894 [Cutaneotrichosporon oleaginosum]KLT43972.1 hypothetical protein CC85DRAFT_300894 [Cutaneotrichosporon oleaginosum]TXT04080.1 hypothetical protein COLE_07777 [Cutaneotrichosporon oleaginosum]
MAALVLKALSKLLATGTWPRRRRAVPVAKHHEPDHEPDSDPDPLLDSSAFPHLLDLIIAASLPHELMALRQTSKGARSRADAALFSHVAIIALDYPTVEYWAPDMQTRLPLQPRMDADWIDHAAKLTHTRTLDIYPAGARGSGPAATPAFVRGQWALGAWPPATLLHNPSIVRRADTSMPHPPTTTLVDYIDLSSPNPPDQGFIHASGECVDYVLHLSFVQSSNSFPRGLMMRGAKRSHGVKSVTLVLCPQGDGDDEEYEYLAGRADRFDVLLPFLHSLVPWLAGGASLTLVGVERCQPYYIGIASGHPIESRRQRRRNRTRRIFGGNDHVEVDVGGTISPQMTNAMRARLYEISVADATFGRSVEENWHWDRSEIDRAHKVSETMRVVTFDQWRAETDSIVAEWRPKLSL